MLGGSSFNMTGQDPCIFTEKVEFYYICCIHYIIAQGMRAPATTLYVL